MKFRALTVIFKYLNLSHFQGFIHVFIALHFVQEKNIFIKEKLLQLNECLRLNAKKKSVSYKLSARSQRKLQNVAY
jgi:hypothetical protein